MRHRKIIASLLLLALGAGATALRADEESPRRVDLMYGSRGVVAGVERTGATLQTDAVWQGEAWRALAEVATPFAADEERRATVGAGYRWLLGEDEAWRVEAALRHTWAERGLASEARRMLTADISVTLPAIRRFTPSVDYAHDFRRQADLVQVALAHSIALTKLGAFVDGKIFSGWAAGEDWRPDAAGLARADSYEYWGVEASVPYRIGLHTTVVAGLHYTSERGRSELNGPSGLSRGQNFWITFGVSLDF